MRTLYFDCAMGASGDMLMAALAELTGDVSGFANKLGALGIPGVTIKAEERVKCGVHGSHISVLINGEDEAEARHSAHHSHVADIEGIINSLPVSDRVKADALAVYGIIAEAEAAVHHTSVREVHFHEVGALDAVADVVGVCMLMEQLAPERVLASAVHVGSGTVRCAHGLLPVPAPATELILRGVPIYGGEIRGELCTPTGAALLRHFVSEFGKMPVMRVKAIGHGMGTRDFPAANCVRAVLGETDEHNSAVWELSCSVDDMTGEDMGFALELLMQNGALDAYTMPIGMKKSRPGVLLCCICRESEREALCQLILKNTTTLGLRMTRSERVTLERRIETVSTRYGAVRVKFAAGPGISKAKPEYEDLARIAREHGITPTEARTAVLADMEE